MGSQPPRTVRPPLGAPMPPSPYVGDLENDADSRSWASTLHSVLSLVPHDRTLSLRGWIWPLARKWCYGSGAVAPFKKGDRPAWQLRAASHRGYGGDLCGRCWAALGMHLRHPSRPLQGTPLPPLNVTCATLTCPDLISLRMASSKAAMLTRASLASGSLANTRGA